MEAQHGAPARPDVTERLQVDPVAYQDGEWNLEDQAEELTQGIADRVRAEDH
ncbi:hypothetical protein ACIOKD_40800 [Streptomyces sp. NPDC087844]|uniref:hypothetical protein n=1 Tax=Streptomyces sp. NPDC087844 TaxID=3365805 RepID=UPI00380B8A8A